MADAGGSVTLIFYKIGSEFWREPFLNLLAAAMQMSSFTHVEIAIGLIAASASLHTHAHALHQCAQATRPARSAR